MPASSRHQAEGIRSKATREACSGLRNSALPQRSSSLCAVSSCRQQACDRRCGAVHNTLVLRGKEGVGAAPTTGRCLSYFSVYRAISATQFFQFLGLAPLSLQNPYPSLRSSSWWSHWAKVEDGV